MPDEEMAGSSPPLNARGGSYNDAAATFYGAAPVRITHNYLRAITRWPATAFPSGLTIAVESCIESFSIANRRA